MADLPYQQYAKYSLKDKQPTLFNDSVSGKSLSRHVNGHYAEINISYPQLTATEFAELDGFLTEVSTFESFTLSLPDREPQGVATGAPLVNSAHSKGESSINVDGWTVGTTDIFKAGDILTFANSTHVYTNLTDVNSDTGSISLEDGTGVLLLEGGTTDEVLLEASGQATLSIDPPLKESVSDNEALTITSVKFTVKCTDVHQSKVAPPILYDFNFNVREVS